mmetsp:Transcript_27480/g.84822  ORF Transcript_27480/g.84822 Transcript_27480/m.84822 type:complete len:411 (-) Transcript_27480:154-1386(-)
MDQPNTIDTADGVVVQADGTTLLAKLCFDGRARLGELGDCSVESLRVKFRELHGDAAATGELTYTLGNGDNDELDLVTDEDVRLAKKFGTEPIKVTSTPRAIAPSSENPTKTVFEHASDELGRFGLDAPAAELKKLLDVLKFKPRRLVKAGLAPAHALKVDEAPRAEPVDDDDDDDEPFDGVELVEALALDDKDDAEPVAGEAAAAAAAEAMEAASVDVVAAAIAAKGVTLAPNVLHTVLRVLHCRPKRCVKVGLVSDIKEARASYKVGGKSAAKELFRDEGCRGGGRKGWGRGLCGRGRGGAGWAHGEPPKKKSCGGASWSSGSGGGGHAWGGGGHGAAAWGASWAHGHGRGGHGASFWGPPPPRGPRDHWGPPPPHGPTGPCHGRRAALWSSPPPPPPPDAWRRGGNW